MARAWGFWTRGKLEILTNYLNAFTTASKSVNERIYLDLFAGQPENIDSDTGAQIAGSAQVVLSVADPPFTRLRFFELDHAADLAAALHSQAQDRDVEVYEGDCNERIRDALDELAVWRWAPTFAFLDPNGPDYRWSTLEQLAVFKRGSRYKVELWILFPEPMFVRFLRVDGGPVRQEDAGRITSMYGTEEWIRIYEHRLAGVVTPGDARAEYVNLMRWRLEAEFGYRWTHSFEVKNRRGNPIYHMIFATDNQAGNDIMEHLYGQAARDFPTMREEAEDIRRGTPRLFDFAELGEDVSDGTRLYIHERQLPPYGSADRASDGNG